MKKILLCSMPLGTLDRPALGLSILKPSLVDQGISCEIRYLNFRFAELIGSENYHWLAYELPHIAFAGDWAFAEALYGHNSIPDRRFQDEILRKTWLLSEDDINRVKHVRDVVEPFLEYCMESVPWQDYAIIGFTSTFEQNIASLAIAKRLKEKYPGIINVFGGGNWEDEMGLELHRQFPFVDYVCPGEADISFPRLAKRLLSGKPANLKRKPIPGVIYRSRGKSNYTGPSELVHNLDDLPIPDYSDFFKEFENSSAASCMIPNILFEGSRGCWWGQKSQCMFCGLNSGTLRFRSKSAKRSLEEIDYMVKQWQFDYIQAVDNIMDMRSFEDFLPAIIESDRNLQFFYEVKSNLKRKHLKLLSEAGVTRVQPGIESLSNHVLELMRKGVKGLQNIQMMKWSREYGVIAEWNILYGFPGETRRDYEEMLEIMKPIRFLKPPGACGPIRLDRFSPYFKQYGEFGLTNLRPLDSYKYIYPFEKDVLMNIAYYFDYDYEKDVDPHDCAEIIKSFVNEWQENPETGTLSAVPGKDGKLTLTDTRSDAVRPAFVLRGVDRELYEFCDSYHSLESVCNHLREKYPDRTIPSDRVRGYLDALVKNQLMVTDGQHFLSLALRVTPIEAPKSTRELAAACK